MKSRNRKMSLVKVHTNTVVASDALRREYEQAFPNKGMRNNKSLMNYVRSTYPHADLDLRRYIYEDDVVKVMKYKYVSKASAVYRNGGNSIRSGMYQRVSSGILDRLFNKTKSE